MPKNSNLNLINQAENATNNKMTDFEQKVAAKNSNLNLINQAENAPKKVFRKNSNQKMISNMEDGVFQSK
uniref:Small, acid-soluble spore protein gamma-type n=1 Tax=Strongyloides papillosus TaxID=174720 RepID=A0A0N5BB43_STREA